MLPETQFYEVCFSIVIRTGSQFKRASLYSEYITSLQQCGNTKQFYQVVCAAGLLRLLMLWYSVSVLSVFT